MGHRTPPIPPPPAAPHPEPHPVPRGRSRFPSERPGAVKQILAIWPILTSLAVGAVATWGWLESALDARIGAAVQAHDREHTTAAHPAIQTRLEAVEGWSEGHLRDHAVLLERVDVTEDQLYELYWFYVGARAAELEPNRRKRAQAANAARERFRRYVREGEELVDAFRHALESRPPR